MAAAKASSTARGYGTKHRQQRAIWARKVNAGTAFCSRCGVEILPGEAFDLDHDDFDRTKYRGASHAACNRSAGGRKRWNKPPVAGRRVEPVRKHSRIW